MRVSTPLVPSTATIAVADTSYAPKVFSPVNTATIPSFADWPGYAIDQLPIPHTAATGFLVVVARRPVVGSVHCGRFAQLQPERAYQCVVDLVAVGGFALVGFCCVLMGDVLREWPTLVIPMAQSHGALAPVETPAIGNVGVVTKFLVADRRGHACRLLVVVAVYGPGVWLEFDAD